MSVLFDEIYIYKTLFSDISTFMGYLMTKPYLLRTLMVEYNPKLVAMRRSISFEEYQSESKRYNLTGGQTREIQCWTPTS